MTTAADYNNRIFDVLAIRGAQPVGDVLLDLTLFGPNSSGEVCTGVQKLAQRWLLAFTTEKGSIAYLPDIGTAFMTQAKAGFRSEVDVASAFQIALVDVDRYLKNEEDTTWNDEDRYDRAELIQITLTNTTVSLSVAVYSLAGEARRVVLPISTVPAAIGV